MTVLFGEAVDFRKWDLAGGNGLTEESPWVFIILAASNFALGFLVYHEVK